MKYTIERNVRNYTFDAELDTRAGWKNAIYWVENVKVNGRPFDIGCDGYSVSTLEKVMDKIDENVNATPRTHEEIESAKRFNESVDKACSLYERTGDSHDFIGE